MQGARVVDACSNRHKWLTIYWQGRVGGTDGRTQMDAGCWMGVRVNVAPSGVRAHIGSLENALGE